MLDFLSQALSALMSVFKKKSIVVYAFLCGQITAFLYPDEAIKLAKQYIPAEATSLMIILLPFFKVCLVVYTVVLCARVWADGNNELLYVKSQSNYGWLCFAIHVCTSLQISPSNINIFLKNYLRSASMLFIIACFFMPLVVIYLRKAFDKWKRKRKESVIQHTSMEQSGNGAVFKKAITPLPDWYHQSHDSSIDEDPSDFAFGCQQSYGAEYKRGYHGQRIKCICFNANITDRQR